MNHTIHIRQGTSAIGALDGETVLDAALRAGIAFPHSCRSGRCGACKSHLLGGSVELLPHSRFALSEDERKQGVILACRALPRSDIAVAWMDEAEPDVTLPVRSTSAVVRSNKEIAPGIRQLIVQPLGESFSYLPGQYMRLTFPGAPPRSYSPANQPGSDGFEFHVALVKGGTATRIVAEALPPGTEIGLHGPFGNAYHRDTHQGPVLAAGAGTGMAAVLPVVERALRVRPGRPVRLYVAARSQADVYMRDRIDELAATHQELFIRTVITGGVRPSRIEVVLKQDLQDIGHWRVHTAGPPRFVEAVKAAVSNLGGQPFHIHSDAFYSQD